MQTHLVIHVRTFYWHTMHPIQRCSMCGVIGVSATMAFSGAIDNGIQWYRMVSFGPLEQWIIRCGYNATCANRQHQNSRRDQPLLQRSTCRWCVVLLCYTSHCTFSTKAVFLSTWSQVHPTHKLTTFCTPLLNWSKQYGTIPRYTALHTEHQSSRNSILHWAACYI